MSGSITLENRFGVNKMELISLKYAIFVIVLLVLYYCFPKKYRWYVLLAGSMAYYVIICKWYVLFIIFTICSGAGGQHINKTSSAIRITRCIQYGSGGYRATIEKVRGTQNPQKHATRAAILEKLVSSGYVQRKGKQMIPTEDGVAAIRNIPDYLKSASMTAEWENDLLRMERGEIKPYDFMQGIHGLLDKMLADLRQIPTVAAPPNHNKVSVGSCPVCGNPVHESKLSFCCADRSCKFALWKESRYLSNMRKTLDKKMAVDLLKKGRTHVKDFYSAKKDKTFAADLVMRVEEGRAQYSLEFPKTPMKTKT